MDHPRSVLKVRQAIRAHLPDPGTHVIVACSGGADSLALVYGLAWEANQAGVIPSAIIVDHQIQDGSAMVAASVAEQVGELMPASVVQIESRGDGGPEGAARAGRYAAIAAHAQTVSPNALVLLGHTRDDQAETVLLGLGRGSGPRSIAGMAPTGMLPGSTVPFARPFLDLDRIDLERALSSWGAQWWTDPSNAVDGPWRSADGSPLRRSAIRHRALPALSKALGTDVRLPLAATARLLQTDLDYLDQVAAEMEATVRDGERLVREGLDQLHPAISFRVLRSWLLAAGARPGELSRIHLETVMELAEGQRADLPGLVVSRTGGRLVLDVG